MSICPVSHSSHKIPEYPDEQVKQFVGVLHVAQLAVISVHN